MRALIVFVLTLLAVASSASAEPVGRWVITFEDTKDAAQRCDLPPARLWISKQSAVIRFDGHGSLPGPTRIVVDFGQAPVTELHFELRRVQNSGPVAMTGKFGEDSGTGTWKAPASSCTGTWTARRTFDLTPRPLAEIELKTTSGPCPEDMGHALVPLAVENRYDQSKSYRRAELLSVYTHLIDFLLETADGEHLYLAFWYNPTSELAGLDWISLSRECKGSWTMTRKPQ